MSKKLYQTEGISQELTKYSDSLTKLEFDDFIKDIYAYRHGTIGKHLKILTKIFESKSIDKLVIETVFEVLSRSKIRCCDGSTYTLLTLNKRNLSLIINYHTNETIEMILETCWRTVNENFAITKLTRNEINALKTEFVECLTPQIQNRMKDVLELGKKLADDLREDTEEGDEGEECEDESNGVDWRFMKWVRQACVRLEEENIKQYKALPDVQVSK